VPIYEYVCEACGRLTEVMQKVNDPAPAACPECGAAKLAKLVSRTTFQLKGGGWYSDLYSSPKAKDGGAAKATDGAAAKPKPDAGAAGKKEAPASPPAAPAGSGSSGSGSGSGGSGSGGGPSPGGASRKSG